MNRYFFSLCVVVMIFAMCESMNPASGSDEGSSSGPLAELKDKLKKKLARFKAPFLTTWDKVKCSETGNELGKLKLENVKTSNPRKPDLYYKLYPADARSSDGKKISFVPNWEFKQDDVKDTMRNVNVVTFKLKGDDRKEYTLTFAKEIEAYSFVEQASYHNWS